MGDRKNTIVFNSVSASNLVSKDDPHMHEGKITFVDKDSIKSTWTNLVDGKPAEGHSFEMTRKKQERKEDKAR